MAKKIHLCLVFLLMALCSSAFASEPRLVTIHDTVVKNIYSQDVSKAQSETETDYVTIGVSYDTAEFFCVTLEVVDDEGEMPYIDNINPPNISFELSGGKYSFWNSYKVEDVNDTPMTFMTARTESLFNNIDETLRWGVNRFAYVPTNSEGDWVHFLNNAETGLKDVTVTWRYPEYYSNETHTAKVPALRTTAQQLADFVPVIEYKTSGTMGNGNLMVTGIDWKLVKSADVNTAIKPAQDIHFEIVSVFGENNDMAQMNEIISFDIKANESASGTVNNLSLNGVPWCTIVRYYLGNDRSVAYQWRFISSNGNNIGAPVNSLYRGGTPSIRAGLTDGKSDYTYARYEATNVADIAMWPAIVDEKYLTDGTFTIKGGGTFAIRDADGETIRTFNSPDVDITLPLTTRTPLGNSYIEFGYMTEGYRKEYWKYVDDAYSTRTTWFMDETGSLNGKEVSWTFPKAPELNGSGKITAAKKLSEQFDKSTGGFFPYVEIVSADGYITAVNYRLVQSRDIATAYDPGVAVMLRIDVRTEHGATWDIPNGTLSNVTWNGNWETEYKPSGTLTLKERIKLGEYTSIHVTLNVYSLPCNQYTYDGSPNPDGVIETLSDYDIYNWNFVDEPPAAETHVMSDSDIETVSEDKLAEALGAASGEEFNFTERQNIYDETQTTAEALNYLEGQDSEMVGRFKQLYGRRPGWYVTRITLPPELFDIINGVSADLLKVFAVPESRLHEQNQGNLASLASVRLADDKPVTGSLVNLDGSKVDKIDGTEFLMVSYLESTEEISNMYLGLAEETETPANNEDDNGHEAQSADIKIDIENGELSADIPAESFDKVVDKLVANDQAGSVTSIPADTAANITEINAETFKKLTSLVSVDLTKATGLTVIVLDATSSITEIKLGTNNSSLTTVNIAGSKIQRLDAPNCTGVKTVNLKNCANLEYADLSSADISSLDLTGCKNIKTLKVGNCKIQSIEGLEDCKDTLTELNVSGNGILMLDLTNFSKLTNPASVDLSGQKRDGWIASTIIRWAEFFAGGEKVFKTADTSTNYADKIKITSPATGYTQDSEGNVTFTSTPESFSYEYEAKEGLTSMDVTISGESSDENADGSGGGCNSIRSEELGIRSVLMFLMFILVLNPTVLKKRKS